MWVSSLELLNIRSFQGPQRLVFSKGINVVAGPNNIGKSTLIRAIWQLQNGSLFDRNDVHDRTRQATVNAAFEAIDGRFLQNSGEALNGQSATVYLSFQPPNGAVSFVLKNSSTTFGVNNPVLQPQWPNNFLVPFLSKRRVANYEDTINEQVRSRVDGTLSNLYARVDDIAAGGHPNYDKFRTACTSLLGLNITTKVMGNGKRAGYYVPSGDFITVDRMGDGVAQTLGLLSELCTARDKLFLVEEPESDLHPLALRRLLELIAEAATDNQFLISTHSNIVLRRLAAVPDAKLFRLDTVEPGLPPRVFVEEVADDPIARRELLEDLGYEVWDAGLWKGWLILEESSAEEIINTLLIPWFVKELRFLLGTRSTNGVQQLPPRLDDFLGLAIFLHREPVYRDRVWVIADGDTAGKAVMDGVRKKFQRWKPDHLINFSKPAFENYYPARFENEVAALFATKDRKVYRTKKVELLRSVKDWAKANEDQAKMEFAQSAAEIITILQQIKDALT